MIFEKYANMKYKYGNRYFWCRGYYVDTVGRNKKAIAEYIRKQLQEDISYDQMSLVEYVDPFTEPLSRENHEFFEIYFFTPIIDYFYRMIPLDFTLIF